VGVGGRPNAAASSAATALRVLWLAASLASSAATSSCSAAASLFAEAASASARSLDFTASRRRRASSREAPEEGLSSEAEAEAEDEDEIRETFAVAAPAVGGRGAVTAFPLVVEVLALAKLETTRAAERAPRAKPATRATWE